MAGYPGDNRHSQYRRSSDYSSLGDALGGQHLYPQRVQSQAQQTPQAREQSGQQAQPQQYPNYQQQQSAYQQQQYPQPQNQNWSEENYIQSLHRAAYPQSHITPPAQANPSPAASSARPSSPAPAASRSGAQRETEGAYSQSLRRATYHHPHSLPPTQANPSPGASSARPSSPAPAARRSGAHRESLLSRSSSPQSSASPLSHNYSQLAGAYRGIIDAASSARPPDHATVQRMLSAATQGQQILLTMTTPPTPQQVSSSAPTSVPIHHQRQPASPSASSNASGSGSGRGQPGNQSTETGQTCLGCNATQTPEWRRGPLGPRTLCNACGLVYAKLLKKRASKASGHDDLGGGSDDDDDTGSPSLVMR